MNLLKEIKKFNKNYKFDREKLFEIRKKQLIFYKFLQILVLLMTAFYVIDYATYGADEIFIKAVNTYVIFLTILIYLSTYKRQIPVRFREFESYLWNIEKKRMLVLFFGYLVLAITSFLLGLSKIALFFAVVQVLNFLVLLLMMVCVYRRPEKIKSNILTGLATGLFYLHPIVLVAFMVSKWINFDVVEFSIIITIVVSLLIYYTYLNGGHGKLNLFQRFLLRIVPSEKIIYALASEAKLLKNRQKAINLLLQLEKPKMYGVRKALEQEILKNKEKSSFLIIIVFVVLQVGLFFIASVAEGLIQDFVNETVKEFICINFNYFC